MDGPIAIVGMGCRFPGADTPQRLWDLLCRAADVTGTPLPAEDFDPAEYHLTAREAAVLDPQHRVLLATARDAMRDARRDPRSLAGQGIGVFMGQSTGEYWDGLRGTAPVDLYAIAGAAARSMASGRIGHAWDLRGPCATVDAACSSGSLAVHLAVQSLRTGECDTALAGGVSLVLGDDHTAGYAAAGLLSPTGRCRFADEWADGFVRADGAGVLVLRPLAHAVRDRDRVHAVILGSAQASKGRTAKAIVAPSEEGYRAVIARAAAVAGVLPGDIGYVEAHGNGAPAGDLVELRAIGAEIGVCRPAGLPCLVGSVKTNIGHPEAAGGLAGLVKAALVLRHRTVAASPHRGRPTSGVDWAGLGIAPVPRTIGWPHPGPAFAGVSTYGLSGTFVHVLLGEPPR